MLAIIGGIVAAIGTAVRILVEGYTLRIYKTKVKEGKQCSFQL